jgi:hypothetical protein
MIKAKHGAKIGAYGRLAASRTQVGVTPCRSRNKTGQIASGAFVSQGQLNAWVRRVGAQDPDWYLVAKAITIAIRRRRRPGTAIDVRWLSHLSGGLQWKQVLAVINNLRNAGRLRFTKIGVDLESRFLFTITNPSEEEAWDRMQGSPRAVPASAAECAGVKVTRVPAVPEWRRRKY